MDALSQFLAAWLGTLFVYVGTSKLARYDRARSLVVAYDALPRLVAVPFGLALPWLELATGSLLLLGLSSPAGPFMGVALGLCFTYGSAHTLVRGRKVPCGCGGSSREIVGRGTLIRALVIVGGSGVLLALTPPILPTLVALPLLIIALAPAVWAVLRHRDASQAGWIGPLHQHAKLTQAELRRLTALIA